MSEETKVRSICRPMDRIDTTKVENLCKTVTGLVLHMQKCREQNNRPNFVKSINTLMDSLVLNKIKKNQELEFTINNNDIDAIGIVFSHIKHLTIHDQTDNTSANYLKFLSILPKVETLSLIRSRNLKTINKNCVPFHKYVDLSLELLHSIAKLVHLRVLKLNGFRILLIDTGPQPALQVRHLILSGGNLFWLLYAQCGNDTFDKNIFELFVTNLARQFPNIEELTIDDCMVSLIGKLEGEFRNSCKEKFVYLQLINLSDSRDTQSSIPRYSRNITIRF